MFKFLRNLFKRKKEKQPVVEEVIEIDNKIPDYYQVQGDTLEQIAKKFKTTPHHLMMINGLENKTLCVGQRLLVK